MTHLEYLYARDVLSKDVNFAAEYWFFSEAFLLFAVL